jgi:2-amino-4-hydroxy-6-hydroxymethyldihydropteridine diphosphokinase
MSAIYIGLGANLGNRRDNLATALSLLEPLVRVEAVSALYESPPQAPAPPPSYLNAACRIDTDLPPLALFRHLKRIEWNMGRRSGERWAPRVIDLDLLIYDDRVLHSPDLQVPHERLVERAFVLQPLLDLDPALVHPASREPLLHIFQRTGRDGLQQVAPIGWQIPASARR